MYIVHSVYVTKGTLNRKRAGWATGMRSVERGWTVFGKGEARGQRPTSFSSGKRDGRK